MTAQREDLLAAASSGLLHYRQVEPLWVFLLQRDVVARRIALQQQVAAARSGKINRWLALLAGLLALQTAGLFGVLFATRIMPAPSAVAGLATVYAIAVVMLVRHFRHKPTRRRSDTHLIATMMLTSLPLALLMFHQAVE